MDGSILEGSGREVIAIFLFLFIYIFISSTIGMHHIHSLFFCDKKKKIYYLAIPHSMLVSLTMDWTCAHFSESMEW